MENNKKNLWYGHWTASSPKNFMRNFSTCSDRFRRHDKSALIRASRSRRLAAITKTRFNYISMQRRRQRTAVNELAPDIVTVDYKILAKVLSALPDCVHQDQMCNPGTIHPR